MKYNRAVSPHNLPNNNLVSRLRAQNNKIHVVNNNDLPRPQPRQDNINKSANKSPQIKPAIQPAKRGFPVNRQPPSQRVNTPNQIQPQQNQCVQDSARHIQRPNQPAIIRNNQKFVRQDVKQRKEPRVSYTSRTVDPIYLEKTKILKNTGRNKILIIIGNGPTINEVDFRPLRGRPGIEFLSINHPDPRLWPTEYWAFFDQSQAQRHAGLWDEYTGTIFNSASIQRRKTSTIQFRNIGSKSFSKNLLDGICIGRSSVFASMQIALWMNFDKVYIFGVDMNPSADLAKLHFYGTNPDVLPKTRADRFEKESEYYMTAWEAMNEEERSKFIFCSAVNPWPFVKLFGSRDHKEVVPEILEKHNEIENLRKASNG